VGLDCQMTAIHHIKYNDDDPLKDTREFCPSCHLKESRRIAAERWNNKLKASGKQADK
jgi:hypothetical protein